MRVISFTAITVLQPQDEIMRIRFSGCRNDIVARRAAGMMRRVTVSTGQRIRLSRLIPRPGLGRGFACCATSFPITRVPYYVGVSFSAAF